MDKQISRRGLLGAGAAVGAASVATAAQAQAAPTPSVRTADVIVVGAGAAGSAAAHAIAKAGKSVYVLEARDRVGGRTLNHELGPRWPGKVSEIGGTFIGPTQDHMYALVHELGLSTFPTYDTGQTTSVYRGQKGMFSNSNPLSFLNISPDGGPDAIQAIVKIDQLASQIPVKAAWTAPDAENQDSQTLRTWTLQNMLTDDGRGLVDVLSTGIFGGQARDLSLLWALYYIAAAGDEQNVGTLERLISTTGGAQQDRIVGGSQLIWITIAQQLGRRVVLNAPVSRIVQTSTGVQVYSAAGQFVGKQVIVAMSPTLAGKVAYEPQLPPLRDQLTQRFPMGSYAKVEAVYRTPFWRNNGSNGQAFGDNGVCLTFDTSPPDGNPGVMAAFIGGTAARHWDQLSAPRRRAFVLNAFAEYFGPEMLKPLDYFEARWTADLWSRGDPTGFTAPGVLLDFGVALRRPIGRIHWAGTETADYWAGYMEGAVRSGQRAAAEVLGAL